MGSLRRALRNENCGKNLDIKVEPVECIALCPQVPCRALFASGGPAPWVARHRRYTGRVDTLFAFMRRLVILFMLFLLPIEVFAGIAYEQHLAQDAQHESSQSYLVSAADPSAALNASGSPTGASVDLQADDGFALDLGEAFDVPCQSFRKPAPRVASAPLHATFCDKSVVADVPIPVAIQTV